MKKLISTALLVGLIITAPFYQQQVLEDYPEPIKGSELKFVLEDYPEPIKGSEFNYALEDYPEPIKGSELKFALEDYPEPIKGSGYASV